MSRAAIVTFASGGNTVPATRIPTVADSTIQVDWDELKNLDGALHVIAAIRDAAQMPQGTAPAAPPAIAFNIKYEQPNVGNAANVGALNALPDIKWAEAPAANAFVAPLAELVLAAHVGQLKTDHVRSWCLSHNIPEDVTDEFYGIVPTLQKFLTAIWCTHHAERTTWIIYRLTEQSTATLCKQALSSVGTGARFVYSPVEIAAINTASPFHLTSGIPNEAIAKSFVILEATGYSFGKWYQGQKAMDTWSASKASYLRASVLASIKKKVSQEAIEAAEDADEVLALAGLTVDAANVTAEIKVRMAKIAAQEVAAKYLKKRGLDVAPGSDEFTTDQLTDAFNVLVAQHGLIEQALAALRPA